MKAIKSISLFLGISMFMFGVLKFVDPFKGWYTVQVTNSGLGEFSYWLGITGEIAVGLVFLLSVYLRNVLSVRLGSYTLMAVSGTVLVMMMTGIYVHLHPNVPADVLPLKIKPPYIPVFFMLLALWNGILAARQAKRELA